MIGFRIQTLRCFESKSSFKVFKLACFPLRERAYIRKLPEVVSGI